MDWFPSPICSARRSRPIEHARVLTFVGSLLRSNNIEEWQERLRPRVEAPAPRVPGGSLATSAAIERRLALLNASPEVRSALADPAALDSTEQYQSNIEHLIGTIKVPVGIAGPLRVNALFASGDYYVPLATKATSELPLRRGA